MKQTLKTLIRNVKSIKGNSLAEFATTTALMATLAATAAPKLSEMSEGAKAQKSRDEIDKMIKQAGQFYQDKAESEGRGRFPGQIKFNDNVGHAGTDYDNSGANPSENTAAIAASLTHRNAIETDLGVLGTASDNWRQYNDTPNAIWVSVFGTSSAQNADNPMPSGAAPGPGGTTKIVDNATGNSEWKNLFGDEVMGSTFQDGHYVYSVVAGGGSGSVVYPPILYVADIENAVDFNNLLEP